MTTDPYNLRNLSIDALRAKRVKKWQNTGSRYASWVADMDFDVAPAISERLHSMLDRQEFGYPVWQRVHRLSPAGQAFIPRMQRRFGWTPDIERVFELGDVVQGVRTAIEHCSSPGDAVVVHLPAYTPFLEMIEDMGRTPIYVMPTGMGTGVDDPVGFDYDALDAQLANAGGASVFILCHPQNPLGHIFDRDELEQIAAIAERYDMTVISDEIWADFTSGAERHVPFAALDAQTAARTVTVTSSSKSFNLAGLRWAVMHTGSDHLLGVLRGLPEHYQGVANVMGVEATLAAWEHGDEWFDAMYGVVQENQQALVGLLAEHVPGARYLPAPATYVAWVDCNQVGCVGSPYETFLAGGVELNDGVAFGSPGDGFVRINLATSPQVLVDTVAAMGRCL